METRLSHVIYEHICVYMLKKYNF